MTPTEHTVSVNGFELRYQLSGHGDPLLLLHGFLGSGDSWSTILGGLDRFDQHYQLIVPDLRSHGGSTNPSGEFSTRQSALDIFALLDHLNIERFRAISMSGGGMILLHRATQAPHRVQTLVLISATTHFPKQARTLMRGTTEEAQTEDGWTMMRTLHRHGDAQVRALWRLARGFAESQDDMAFTAKPWPPSRLRRWSCTATATRSSPWTSRSRCTTPFRRSGSGSCRTVDI